MNLVEMEVRDLVTPDRFEITSEDDLFDKLVNAINNELENEAESGEERFATSNAHIEVILNRDDDFSEDVTPDMALAVEKLYQSVGWANVSYEHQLENDDCYESHIFKFYFSSQSSMILPGLAL